MSTEAEVMARSETIRASDEDRERVASLLGEHHALGRLDATEFNRRIDEAYRAVTLGQLDALTRDLPPLHSGPRAAFGKFNKTTRPRSTADRAADRADNLFGALPRARPFEELTDAQKVLRVFWIIWTVATSVNLVVWVLVSVGTARLHYFWPIWVAGPLGAVLLSLTWFARGGSRPDRH
jgi:hypothetical protein